VSRSRDRSRSNVFARLRSLPRLLSAAAILVVVSLPLRAQEPEQQDRMAKLDAKTRAAVELLLDSAAAEGLPTQPLRSIAYLGITRKADGRQIIGAVHRKLVLLRTARTTLGRTDQLELDAAAAVLEAGAKPAQLSVFKNRQRGRSDLQAFTVWADLINRGVPGEDASSAIAHLWEDGADDATFVSLWINVQSDILRGLNPGTALQNRIREAPGRPPTTKGPQTPEGQENARSE
jgi:hypothetical protein